MNKFGLIILLFFIIGYQKTERDIRGVRYVQIEVGHSGENIYLQAEALGLATVAVGAFRDEVVKEVLKLEEEPLYLMPASKRVK